MINAIIFARVSTEEQKKEGSSLPAQIVKMRDYYQRKTIVIKTEYEVDESSTKDERKKFEQVIDEIKKSKEKTALIIETIDRLQRSFRGSVILDDLRKQDKVEIHFLRENLIISINSNSAELLRWDMGVMFARSFVLQLSDNVKRSIEHNLKNGILPGRAPYGYKNIIKEDGKKDIVVDEFKSKIVQKMFEWYSTGAFSMLLVKEKLKKDYDIDLSKGFIDAILKNPFYYGKILHKGKLYPHRYQPIITKELFDKVQQVKAGYNKKHFKYAGLPYAYRGLIRCSYCGCMITPEEQKGHIYYHCTNFHKKHIKHTDTEVEWLREEEITEQFGKLFIKLQIPQEVLEDIIVSLKNVHKGKIEFRQQQYEELMKEKKKYSQRIEEMYLDKLDRRITESEYDKLYQDFRAKIAQVDRRLSNLQVVEDNYYLTANCLLQLANRAYELFKSSEIEQKRQLLKLVLQNLKLEGRTVRYDVLKPFDTIVNCADNKLWYPVPDSNRRLMG